MEEYRHLAHTAFRANEGWFRTNGPRVPTQPMAGENDRNKNN